MSTKYNKYARRLEASFLENREAYRTAADKLTAAEKRKADADVWHSEKYIGERAVKQAKAQAEYIEAKAAFDEVSRSAWESFNRERDRLTAELREAVRADQVVNPSDVDGNSLELLKSGIMNADDYSVMLAKFDGKQDKRHYCRDRRRYHGA